MGDRIKELMEEQHRLEAYPIFVGAVAVCKSATLVTAHYPFIKAMEWAKENIEEAPESFRHRIEHFDIKQGYVLEVSDEADMVFRLLNICADNVLWTDCWGSLGEGRGNGHRGNQYHMDDPAAEAYIVKEGFTPEELEWLWMFAQQLHVLTEKPVERR